MNPERTHSRIDLHTHTTASDGQDTPAALVANASERGISVLGVTDHDTVDALVAELKAKEYRLRALVKAIVLSDAEHRWLLDNPGATVRIDLEATTVHLPTGVSVKFPVEGFARYCLLNGIDELGFLLQRNDAIVSYEQAHA